MSRRKRALEKQRKQNSPAKKAKQSKKIYYASYAAKEKWQKKKEKKEQSQIARKEAMGIPANCPFKSWEEPDPVECRECSLKCSYKARIIN